jgi:hypothetical protein
MELPMAKQAKLAKPEEPYDDGGFDDMYGSNWLSPEDIRKPTQTSIEAWERSTFKGPNGKDKDKIVLTLKGVKKPAVLNKTNATNMADAFGKPPDNWIGKLVLLKVEMTQYGGKPVKGLRLYAVDPNDMQGDKIDY